MFWKLRLLIIDDYCLVQHQALVMHVFDHNLGTPSQKRRTQNVIYSANEGGTRDDAHEYAWTNLLSFLDIRIFRFHQKTKVYSSFLFEHSGLGSAMCPHPLLCVFIPDCLRAHCTCWKKTNQTNKLIRSRHLKQDGLAA